MISACVVAWPIGTLPPCVPIGPYVSNKASDGNGAKQAGSNADGMPETLDAAALASCLPALPHLEWERMRQSTPAFVGAVGRPPMASDVPRRHDRNARAQGKLRLPLGPPLPLAESRTTCDRTRRNAFGRSSGENRRRRLGGSRVEFLSPRGNPRSLPAVPRKPADASMAPSGRLPFRVLPLRRNPDGNPFLHS